MTKTFIRLAVLTGIFATGTAVCTFAQGTMSRPTPPSTTRDSTGNLKTGDTPSAGEAMARGQVTLADGSVPVELVKIHAVCAGTEKFVAVADSKGRFSFNPAVLSDIVDTKGCVLRPSVEGYRSETKPLEEVKPNSNTKLGKILLQAISSDTSGLTSVSGAQASKAAKNAYEKGLDEAV